MRATSVMLALLLAPGLARAQQLAQLVKAAPDGVIRMSYKAREGVCGNGRNINMRDDKDDEGQWKSDCEPGPVRVWFTRTEGRIHDVEVRVGGSWRTDAPSGTDLGAVPAAEAGNYMLDVAESSSPDADDAILAAVLADSITTWPRLLAIARNKSLGEKVRKSALFWVSQAAGDKVVAAMGEIASDATENREVRTTAVFGLSRRPDDEAVPALIRLAGNDRDPEIRRQAMFWLSRSKDPRALDFFEKVLAGS